MNTRILNREFKHPADGWYQIEAKGFHPAIAEGGMKVVQVIDDKAITSIVNRFNADAEAAKLPHGREMLIDHEHFRHDKSKETTAYGWASKLRVSPDGSGFDTFNPWTATGKAAVDGGDYRFTSTEYDGQIGDVFEEVPAAQIPVEMRNKYNGYKFLRPLKLTGLSLTNDLNNKGQKAITITNRKSDCGHMNEDGTFKGGFDGCVLHMQSCEGHSEESAKKICGTIAAHVANRAVPFADVSASADITKNKQPRQQMKLINAELGLSAEAEESAGVAEIHKLKNRITTLEPLEAANVTLKNRATELEGEQCESLMDAHGMKADDPARAKLKPVLISLKNREDRLSFLAECVKVTPAASGRTQVQLKNRDTKPPGGKAGVVEEADSQELTIKIKNRAAELKGAAPTRSFDSCWTQAKQELTPKAA